MLGGGDGAGSFSLLEMWEGGRVRTKTAGRHVSQEEKGGTNSKTTA